MKPSRARENCAKSEPMLTSLEVRGFRGFHRLRLDGLRRVNLLVGRNNTGKSSVLEAVEILMSGGTAEALWTVASRRKERAFVDERAWPTICHLFYGHHIEVGAKFSLASEGSWDANCAFEIAEISQPTLSLFETQDMMPDWVLRAESSFTPGLPEIPIRGPEGVLAPPRGRYRAPSIDGLPPVQFVTTAPVDESGIRGLWDALVLMPDEARIIEAMQIVEPSIRGLAFVGGGSAGMPSGAVLRLEGLERRVPLGTMGDGVKRLLALSLALVRSAGGFLLVDEIETSLHHSVLPSMWRLVLETASRLGIQIFATSHSHDCLAALEKVCRDRSEFCDDVAVLRIERDRETAVRYGGDELEVVIEQELEIRG